MFTLIQNRKGQMLVELALGIGISAMTILAIVKLTNRSVSGSQHAKLQAQASGYATQASEWVAGKIDSIGWQAFAAQYPPGNYCPNYAADNLTSGGPCSLGNLGMSINIGLSLGQDPPPKQINYLRTQVAVTWAESGATQTVQQNKIFYQGGQ